jgi:hypothetical protein
MAAPDRELDLLEAHLARSRQRYGALVDREQALRDERARLDAGVEILERALPPAAPVRGPVPWVRVVAALLAVSALLAVPRRRRVPPRAPWPLVPMVIEPRHRAPQPRLVRRRAA